MQSTTKILQIIPDLAKGGAERLVLDICNELSEREGVEVKLITFSDCNLYPDLTKNISWEIVPVQIQLSLWKPNKIDVFQLQQVIEDFKPNVIHTHLFFAEIVTRFCNYPHAKWFSHGHDNMIQLKNFEFKSLFMKQSLVNFYEKKVLRNKYRRVQNQFIAISEDSRNFLRNVLGEFTINLLHNAINFDSFFSAKKKIAGLKLKLISVGSLNDNKNQMFLIDVASKMKEQKTDFVLNILGEGPNRKVLEDHIALLNLQENVFLIGMVENVQTYLQDSNIYIHSALSEALGLTIIEAMASGLPVITLDGRGNRDLIKEGRNGFMIKDNNVECFAFKVIELWNNKTLYNKISKYAQSFASKFNIKEYVDSLLKLYVE